MPPAAIRGVTPLRRARGSRAGVLPGRGTWQSHSQAAEAAGCPGPARSFAAVSRYKLRAPGGLLPTN